MTASQFRAQARQTLGGKLFGAPWLYAAAICLVLAAIAAFASGGILGLVYFVLSGAITVSTASYFVGRARGEKHDNLKLLTTGFTKDIVGNIVMGILVSIFTALWALLFVIPGIVKSYSYALAPYIKNDSSLTGKEAISTSMSMMDGSKWRLFCLDLSFIGWYIVGALCFIVGTLWVSAYHQTARAHFYQELLARKMAAYQAAKPKPAAQPAPAAPTQSAPSQNNNNDKFL